MSQQFQAIVYILCFATSMLCAALLTRRYRASKMRLLLWTASCFGFLALNNLLVVIDLLVFRDIDLQPWRQATGLAAVTVLLFGFIWEAEGA